MNRSRASGRIALCLMALRNTLGKPVLPLLGASERISTPLLMGVVNILGALCLLVSLSFLGLIALGCGAAAFSPTGVTGFLMRNPSLTPTLINTSGLWLIAVMVRASTKRSSDSTPASHSWAQRGTLTAIVTQAAITWFSYWSGTSYAQWYKHHYSATTRAFVVADNAAQAFVIGVTFCALMWWRLLHPRRSLPSWLKREAKQEKGPNRFRQVVVSLVGTLPLLAVIIIFAAPSLRVGGMRWMPALFAMSGMFAIALIDGYAGTPGPEDDRSWAVRTFWTTMILNPLGVFISYWYGAVSALGNGHKRASISLLYLVNMLQSGVGWLYFLLVQYWPLRALPTWREKREQKKQAARGCASPHLP